MQSNLLKKAEFNETLTYRKQFEKITDVLSHHQVKQIRRQTKCILKFYIQSFI